MERGTVRVPKGDDTATATAGAGGGSYWLDACEDISCDFIDFDAASSIVVSVSDHPDNAASNQDFFGGIDRILDSIKNGAGLPLAAQPNSTSTSTTTTADASPSKEDDALVGFLNNNGGLPHPRTHAFDHSGSQNNLSNANQGEGGLLVTCSQENHLHLHLHVDAIADETCNKRPRLASYNNDRPYYARLNHRDRCFDTRKRPRDRDKHCARRDVNVRDHRGYWERDKSGSNHLVFRLGTWEADRHPQDKIPNEVKRETNANLHIKSQEAKDRLPEEKARQYQLDVLQQAKENNTIAFLETGAGKTLIAVLLIKSMQDTLQKQNKKLLAVFLVPKVPLVYQVIYLF